MSACAIARPREITPHPEIAECIERTAATFEPFGGRFPVHSTRHEVLEGDRPGGVVVTGLPGTAEARARWDSPAYQEIAPPRSRHIVGDIILVAGVPEGYDPGVTAAVVRASVPAG
ncbi:DUF1330 domain-containing protein [Streptomyces sp. NPDC006458]|uniref:DUF1330 domain-containing protein n=1 Tax=Streptomyces sp. NPDC006458 TaxID=3154302 RepID=UPI0033B25691